MRVKSAKRRILTPKSGHMAILRISKSGTLAAKMSRSCEEVRFTAGPR